MVAGMLKGKVTGKALSMGAALATGGATKAASMAKNAVGSAKNMGSGGTVDKIGAGGATPLRVAGSRGETGMVAYGKEAMGNIAAAGSGKQGLSRAYAMSAQTAKEIGNIPKKAHNDIINKSSADNAMLQANRTSQAARGAIDRNSGMSGISDRQATAHARITAYNNEKERLAKDLNAGVTNKDKRAQNIAKAEKLTKENIYGKGDKAENMYKGDVNRNEKYLKKQKAASENIANKERAYQEKRTLNSQSGTMSPRQATDRAKVDTWGGGTGTPGAAEQKRQQALTDKKSIDRA